MIGVALLVMAVGSLTADAGVLVVHNGDHPAAGSTDNGAAPAAAAVLTSPPANAAIVPETQAHPSVVVTPTPAVSATTAAVVTPPTVVSAGTMAQPVQSGNAITVPTPGNQVVNAAVAVPEGNQGVLQNIIMPGKGDNVIFRELQRMSKVERAEIYKLLLS